MKVKKNLFLLILFLLITLIPLFLWGCFYFVGGDDSKLYYLFPYEYFKNFTPNLISDNALGSLGHYFSQAYISIFVLFIFLIKKLFYFLNIQLLMYGLNLSLGFLFFYLLLGIWIRNEKWYDFWIKISAGLFYSLSIFSFYTLWSSQLFSMYLVSVFPLALYLFIRGVQENKIIYIVLDSILISAFSVLILSIPWLAALIIAVIPLTIIIFWQNKKRFLFFLTLFIGLVMLLNFYWLFHSLYSPYSSGKTSNDIVSTVSSHDFRTANEHLIRAVSGHNQLVYPLFNLFHKNIQIDYGWKTYKIFSNWHLKLLPFNLFFLVIIFLAAFYFKKSKKIYKKIYISSLVPWIIILYFFTVHIGNWGTDLFLWLNNHIPGFVMFRNMYSKFGQAMAFSYAMLLGISLKICFDHIRKDNFKKIILFVLIGITIINAKPFIFGDYYKNPIWTTKNTYNTISDFNQDFYNLVAYLKTIDEPSRFLWLPLNLANYIQIQDKNLPNHYYSGVSPLQFLAKKADFSGKLSFGNYGKDLFKNIVLEKNYNEAGSFFQKMNVKYIIVNKNISEELQRSYLYSWYSSGDVYNAQNRKFKSVILGDKIKDFGDRYSLYKINSNFRNEKIYLTDNTRKFPSDFSHIEYKKIASYKYKINIKNLKEKSHLVFLDPYHKLWELYFAKNKTILLNGQHELVFGYANGWTIDPEYIKQNFSKKYYKENPDGSIDVELVLYFTPQSYFYLGLLISTLTLLGCLGYLGYDWRKGRRISLAFIGNEARIY